MSWVEVARLPTRQQAEELAFTLSAVGIASQVRLELEPDPTRPSAFALLVEEEQARTARLVVAEEEGPAPAAGGGEPAGPPVRGGLLFTLGLMLLLVAVFVGEQLHGSSESRATLIRFGASFGPGVLEAGQWWRTVTAAFLHIGPQHLLANLVSLFVLGALSKDHFGPGRIGFLWLASAMAGNWTSLMLSSGPMLRARASGGIFGLFGALIGARLGQLRSPGQPASRYKRWHVVGALLAFLALTVGTGPVDYPAHFGGLACGALLGLLLRGSGRSSPARRALVVELVLGAFALGLTAVSGWAAWRQG